MTEKDNKEISEIKSNILWQDSVEQLLKKVGRTSISI